MTEIGFGAIPPESTVYTKTMPDEFVGQVRDLLAHLYEPSHLHTLAIVKERADAQQRPMRSVASSVKQEVIELLEALNPGHTIYFRAPEARAYNILLLHYVERHTVQKAADELGVSERQAYRDLRQAEINLAQLLWQRHRDQGLLLPAYDSTAVLADSAEGEAVDLRELLVSVVDVVRPLATSASTPIHLRLPQHAIFLMLNLPVARQVLIALLSRAIQTAEVSVAITVAEDGVRADIRMDYAPRSVTPELQADAVIRSMAQRLGWGLDWRTSGLTLHLSQPAQQKILLCIDDDASFSELLRRYLTGFPVLVLNAINGQQGIEQILQSSPDIVVLDVMMAGLDGWETLQRIRTYPSLQHLPVVVCSVFDNPELAYSLGATAALAKPLTPGDFLRTLERLGVI